jgi:O-antigen/teichoic acid export membrane protein
VSVGLAGAARGSVRGGGDDAAASLEADHRAERKRRLRFALISSAVARPLAIVIQFVTIPLFIKYLGPEGFGLYESVAALAVWMTLSNAGLALGLQNRLQDCYVSGDRELARRYVSSLSVALVVIGLAGLVVLSVVTPLVDWGRVFPTVSARPAGETAWAVWAAGVLALLGVVLAIPFTAYIAYQETHVGNVWDGVGKLATLAACVGVVWTNFGLVGVVLASTGAYTVVRLVNAVWYFGWEKPWLRPTLRLFDAGLLRVVLTESIYLFGLTLGTVLVFQVDKLIIGNRLGAAEVTSYAVLGRLFLIVYAAFVLIQVPLWPAYGEAMRRGDVAWAKKAVRLMLVGSSALLTAWGTVLFFFGGPIIRFMSRSQDVEVSRSLIVAVTTFFVVRAWAECQSVPLSAAGVLKPQLRILLANGVLNVALALALVKPFGVVGVAWAFPITAMLTSVWGYPVLLRRHLFDVGHKLGSAGAADGNDAVETPAGAR